MKTLSQISKEQNIPQKTLLSAAQGGRIPAQKLGRDWLVFDEKPEFKEFLLKYRGKEEKK